MSSEEIVAASGLATTAIIALIKNNGLLKMLYKDLAQPSISKVGKALEIVFGLSNTILLPIKLLNEKTNIMLTANLKKYEEKLNKIPEEKILQVAPEIGIPIIDCLTYYKDEELVDLFTSLLASASDSEKCQYAHPAYISVIKNISPDEAIILKNISRSSYFENGTMPVISVRKYKNGSYKVLENCIIEEEIFLNVIYEYNKSIYFNNLEKQGILNVFEDKAMQAVNYTKLEIKINEKYGSLKNEVEKNGEKLVYRHSIMQLTEFGVGFLKSVSLI